jgi:hypothetical protein
MRKNQRSMKIIERWKTMTHPSPNFYHLLPVGAVAFWPLNHTPLISMDRAPGADRARRSNGFAPTASLHA